MYKKTYRLNLGYRILLGLMSSIALLPFIIIFLAFQAPKSNEQAIYILLCSGVPMVIVFWQRSIPRIVISDSGIEHYTIDYSIKATWDEVESYRIVAGYDAIGVPNWGLWLRKPALRILPWGWLMALLLLILSSYNDVSRSIPLAPFGGINWQNSNLMKDVRRYLPHLFTEPSKS